MKVSWKWLNELIDIQNISIYEIINKLILAGFEIEEIIDKLKIQDKTINISITANRGDVYSIIGLAREINTLFNLKSDLFYNPYINKYISNKQIKQKDNNLHHLNSNSLLNLKFNTIIKLEQQISPIWLTNYLKACDIKPSHILLFNILEYIKIKWCQDIEIFDLDKVNQNNINDNDLITVDQLKEKDKWMDIINSYDLKLNTSIEILKYNNNILSIIGIKSNPNFSCDFNTSSILIVGQVCKIKYIKQITERLKSKTDKSNRHLKYTSINDFIHAYNEIVNLILYLAKGTLGKLYVFNQKHIIEKKISVNKTNILNILGPLKHNYKHLSQIEILKILKQLNFRPKYENNTFTVTIPEYRQIDIRRSIDVIEEIGRVYGFEKFLDRLPPYCKKGQISETVRFREKARYILRSFGLHQVINYSLEDKFIQHSSKIDLHNPLLEDQSQLKNSLIKDLIITKKYNIKKNNSFLEFFEIGRVFHKQEISIDKNKYIETVHIAGIIGNSNFSKRSWQEKAQGMSWFQAKGLLEDFLEKLNTEIIWRKPKNSQNSISNTYWHSICHPHRISILYNKQTQEQIGIFSELNTKYNNSINSNHRTYIFELNLFNLIKTMKRTAHLSYIYKPYSNYPSVTRDISLKLHKDKTAKGIQEKILTWDNSLIRSVEIFNEYNNQNNSNKYRNIGLRIIYQSEIRTLNDKDLENIDNEITKLLQDL